MKYRNEWKYICSEYQLSKIETKLARTLQIDKFAINKVSSIHSLYFDDYTNSCMFDNDAGLYSRYKWRIRYYNDDLLYIVLERKEKLYGRCRKKSCKINKQIVNDILNNNIHDVFWKTDDELLKTFCIDVMNRMFKPKVIVDYERTAYVEPITNVRITLDKNISASSRVDLFLDYKKYSKYPILEKQNHILEVKFDEILPSYIKQVTSIDSLQQTSFSKYYLSRKILERG